MTWPATADRRATADEVRAHATDLRRLAESEGLGDPRVLADGTVVVHTDEPGYRPLFGFVQAAQEIVGCYVHVITDDVSTAESARPL